MKRFEDAFQDLKNWWDSETDAFRFLVITLISSLPGAEDLADVYGFEPVIGWKEAEILGNLLASLENAEQVQRVAKFILEGGD